MRVSAPNTDELKRLVSQLGLAPTDEELAFFERMLGGMSLVYAALDAMPDELPSPKYPRGPVVHPSPESNPYNAWYVKTRVLGSGRGPLAGKTVVLKDNIFLAGVPMMNGSRTLEDYVPEIDATVVTRVLDAGAEIVGKAHCECLCLSGGSHTNATGAVHNPRRHGYSAGGSSSGCAALVAAGEADMALGGDQGGSIRMPASFCGIYGLKPTHGLVPYTGIVPLEVTLDHAGPMTRSVRDNALLLEAIAGADGYDSRQRAPVTHAYSQLLGGGVAGLRIGVVREGFGHPNSEADVDAKVRAAAGLLAKLGAEVEDVSVPMHSASAAICNAIALAGIEHMMVSGDGLGFGREDLYLTSYMDFHRGWRERANELSESVKLALLCGLHARRQSGQHYYAKAQNLGRRLRAAYDAAFQEHDLLLLPTTPIKATPLPGPGSSREERAQRSFEHSANAQPFDVTHHPALSMPCGMSDGLPIGMMLVGRHWEEPVLYRAAFTFEQAEDWTAL
jgi:amidase